MNPAPLSSDSHPRAASFYIIAGSLYKREARRGFRHVKGAEPNVAVFERNQEKWNPVFL
jgi:hypothetical protein